QRFDAVTSSHTYDSLAQYFQEYSDYLEGLFNALQNNPERLLRDQVPDSSLNMRSQTIVTQMPGTYEYDVAISFAGEQRSVAEDIADCLRNANVRVFYDAYEQSNLWGKDLYEHLADVYQNKARYCLMLVSADYAEKVWTNHERKSAQARALSEKNEYILPIRFDKTDIPGLPRTVGYLRFEDHGVRDICDLLLDKLRTT